MTDVDMGGFFYLFHANVTYTSTEEILNPMTIWHPQF